jgi:tetrahydromethanopterin S-methyltransferase subunit G
VESNAPTAAQPKTTVATYRSYGEAERAVDFLSDRGFPVEKVAIVGTGLKSVEQVAGRLTTGRATLAGAGQGAMIGLLFGLLFGLFFEGPAFFGVILYGLVAGLIFGAIFGALTHAMQGGRRDFASVGGLQASEYELQVEHDASAQAKQLLAEMPAAAAR